MKPAPFEYCRPDTLEESLDLLKEYGDDALVMAGGLSLGAMLNMRMVRPSVIIDINRLDALGEITATETHLRIGAIARQADVLTDPVCIQNLPLLIAGLRNVGHYQTRSRGTLGGSAAHADPSAETPLCLATLFGEIELSSARGVRRVPADTFFEGALMTSREGDEMITALLWPILGQRRGTGFHEINERRGDFAIVSAAAWVEHDGNEIRYGLGFGGVEDRPMATRGVLTSMPSDIKNAANDISHGFTQEFSPMDDHRASAEYRQHLAGHFGPQVLADAMREALA